VSPAKNKDSASLYRILLSVEVFGELIFSSASAAEVDNLTPAVEYMCS